MTPYRDQLIEEIARDVRRTGRLVALTGAGMSVESGVPTFTGPGGIWTKYDPEEFGHVSTFTREPAKAWVLYKDILDSTLPARPHIGHYILATLEQEGLLTCIVTQNVDGLHQKAGSSNVVELHGNNRELRCSACGTRYESIAYQRQVPPHCRCGGYLRPTFILYGESIPLAVSAAAWDAVKHCGVLFVIGSSCRVYPAAALPSVAFAEGAKIVEINPEKSEMSHSCHWYVQGNAGEVLQAFGTKVMGMTRRLDDTTSLT
jgi:NAD-dependent deacetylase